MPDLLKQFFDLGWCRLPYDAQLHQWINHALPYARQTLIDSDNAQWHRCGGTWFAGVNVLPNSATGQIDSGPKLENQTTTLITQNICKRDFGWDKGQISVCFPTTIGR